MTTHICPWWLTYTFDNPLRRLIHDPMRIVRPHVTLGMRVADIGCGMGFFTPSLAELVGDQGRVQAVDLQEQQLLRARRRCEMRGLASRVTFTRATPQSLCLEPALDFVLAFWMVHEVPDGRRFFAEIAASLKPGGKMLIVEPRLHVSGAKFAAEVEAARDAGFGTDTSAGVRISRSVLMTQRR